MKGMGMMGKGWFERFASWGRQKTVVFVEISGREIQLKNGQKCWQIICVLCALSWNFILIIFLGMHIHASHGHACYTLRRLRQKQIKQIAKRKPG